MDMLKVLIADDESRMRKLVKDFLSKAEFIVLEAEDGEQAVDMFFSDKDISLFILALSVYGKGINLVRISIGLMLLFSILTLLFAAGFHKKTFLFV